MPPSHGTESKSVEGGGAHFLGCIKSSVWMLRTQAEASQSWQLSPVIPTHRRKGQLIQGKLVTYLDYSELLCSMHG